MGGITFRPNVTLGTVPALLGTLALRFADFGPLFHGRISTYTASLLASQFASRGTRLGVTWAPLSPTTILLRTRGVRVNPATGKMQRHGARARTNKVGQARAGFATPLQNTRRLWASLTKRAAPEGVRIVEPHRFEWGTALSYAAIHQTGAKARMFGKHPVTIPARVIIPENLPADVVSAYEAMILDFVERGVA